MEASKFWTATEEEREKFIFKWCSHYRRHAWVNATCSVGEGDAVQLLLFGAVLLWGVGDRCRGAHMLRVCTAPEDESNNTFTPHDVRPSHVRYNHANNICQVDKLRVLTQYGGPEAVQSYGLQLGIDPTVPSFLGDYVLDARIALYQNGEWVEQQRG